MEERYQSLFAELSRYEHCGINMKLGDTPASPLQIATAVCVHEDTNYMRDYVWDEAGHVKEITFRDIGNV